MKLKHDLFTDKDYEAFAEKFKPKKTTDDCYTPPIVYDAIADYVADYYNLDRSKFVRPFYPGGDYERFDYPDDCVVVDNPPFSIIAKIARDYRESGIRFFLFAPLLTILGICGREGDISKVIVDGDITYENGAKVNTSFVTNLEPVPCVRADPKLHDLICAADAKNRASTAKVLPKYAYPTEVLTASTLAIFANRDIDYFVPLSETCFIRGLDSQKAMNKAIYGAGLLLKEKAAAEKAAAEKAAAEKAAAKKAAAEKAAAEKAAAEKANAIVWKLSDRERAFVEGRK